MYPEEPMKRSLNVVRYSDSVKVQKRSSRSIFTSDPLPEMLEEGASRLTEVSGNEDQQIKHLRLERQSGATLQSRISDESRAGRLHTIR